MFQLNKLPSLGKKRKRVGRGGSRGGTSGRGHKGQKARTGGASKVRAGFEGGQMPLSRRLPKRGFNNYEFATDVAIVNLDALDRWFENGQEVTKDILFEKGYLKGSKKVQLKVLANGALSKSLIVHADKASKTAREAIERSGGKLHITQEM